MHVVNTTTSSLMQSGTEQIATLRDGASESHIAEHIRGMVAATMAHLSSQASDTARNDAEQWQNWALGVADGLGATD